MSTKTVLITGSNRGIGLAFVEYYISKGWNVIAAARNVQAADKVRIVLSFFFKRVINTHD
jgi:RNA-binding protein with serine-rich domain 1